MFSADQGHSSSQLLREGEGSNDILLKLMTNAVMYISPMFSKSLAHDLVSPMIENIHQQVFLLSGINHIKGNDSECRSVAINICIGVGGVRWVGPSPIRELTKCIKFYRKILISVSCNFWEFT